MENRFNHPDQQDVEKNKTIAILAYIIFFIPLLAARESKFAMYHGNQGLLLFLSGIVVNIVVRILIHIAPLLVLLISPLTNIAILVLAIIGIVNASRGIMKPLPLIGGYTILK